MPDPVTRSIQYNKHQWTLNVPPIFVSLMDLETHDSVSLEFIPDKEDPCIIIRKVKG